MRLYILDTSVVGFALQRHPTYQKYALNLPDETPITTTIITVGEDLSGWLPACRRARTSTERVIAYGRLQRGKEFYQRMTCFPFDEMAAKIFDQLTAQKIRIGTNDLAIAAICLSVNGILVTRNTVDFERVPNLTIEDWTK
jgi:tRNA(fMet)-specific endonuclease VapC